MAKHGRPFDPRIFDSSLYDCNEPDVRVTAGGWAKHNPLRIIWAPFLSSTR
jgi:hypothetical protein